jgi:hypothetical protein
MPANIEGFVCESLPWHRLVVDTNGPFPDDGGMRIIAAIYRIEDDGSRTLMHYTRERLVCQNSLMAKMRKRPAHKNLVVRRTRTRLDVGTTRVNIKA